LEKFLSEGGRRVARSPLGGTVASGENWESRVETAGLKTGHYTTAARFGVARQDAAVEILRAKNALRMTGFVASEEWPVVYAAGQASRGKRKTPV